MIETRRLIIVCGVPGAGKSTFASRLVAQWSAASYASETYTASLGPAARTASGDLSTEAIDHAYSAMEQAVSQALGAGGLVVAVGAFRSEALRGRFREIAKRIQVPATTLRISCSVAAAAKRVRARKAHGESGPTEFVIGQIDVELDRASDIDLVLHNNETVEHLYPQADALIKTLT